MALLGCATFAGDNPNEARCRAIALERAGLSLEPADPKNVELLIDAEIIIFNWPATADRAAVACDTSGTVFRMTVAGETIYQRTRR